MNAKKNMLWVTLSVLLVAAVVLSACAPAAQFGSIGRVR